MRLRRVEFVIIGVTLAFVCFMGGFFTGRNLNSVNVVSFAAESGSERGGAYVQVEFEFEASSETSQGSTENAPAGEITQGAENQTSPQVSMQPPPQSEHHTGAQRNDDGKININTASQTELTDLPGIGNTIASRILQYRQQHGNFRSIEEIMNVSGIGEKRYEAIRELITV